MTQFVTCYAQPDKRKSQDVLRAFALGCGGRMASTTTTELQDGSAAFYGVRPPWLHLLEQARQRTFYYLDNSFLDAGREHYFRVGVNELQTWSKAPSDGKRLSVLGAKVQPWTRGGSHVLVCPQSSEFMATLGGQPDWLCEVREAIATYTDRPIRVRAKGSTQPLLADLRDAWIAVGHSTAVLNEALLAGIPVIATGHCAATEFASTFDAIETPRRDEGRHGWAARLADSQWTLDEMRSGLAWKALTA